MGISSSKVCQWGWPFWGAGGLALFEYMLQLPANRLGYGTFSAYQLKVIHECITLCVFVAFAALVSGEKLSPRYAVSFGLILAAVAVAFYK